MELDDIASVIVDSAFGVSKELGPGLLESVYRKVHASDMMNRGLYVEQEKPISFDYRGLWFDNGFRIDLLVERKIVVEIKSAAQFCAADYKQLLTYLRLTGLRLGFLINFGAPTLKQGIKRMINGF